MQQRFLSIFRGTHGRRQSPIARRTPRLEPLEDRMLLSVSMVKDLNTAPQSSSPGSFLQVNGLMFFVAYDPKHGDQLWRTDGTAAGTEMVKATTPGPAGSHIGNLASLNGDAYFTAIDSNGNQSFWKSDGTAAGTVQIRHMPTTIYGGMTSVDGYLYFDGFDSSGSIQLFRSNGTGAGTVQLTTTGIGNQELYLTDLGGTVYFVFDDNGHGQLWKTNGTPGGTSLVYDIGGQEFTGPASLINVVGTLFFVADNGGGPNCGRATGRLPELQLLRSSTQTSAD
jgi:ELWxxDGT repeat protein